MRVLALSAVIAACSFSPDLGEGEFACASDGTCPEGYACSAADHRCYRSGGPGIDAPVDAPLDASAIDTLPDAVECTPDVFLRCEGDAIIRCNDTGDGEQSANCALGCNMAAARCNVCMIGSMTCDSQGHVLTCSEGTGYVPSDCPASSNPCTLNLCQGAGQCTLQNKPDSTPCSGGICVAGACVCGGAGQPCCSSGPSCSGSLVCMNGTCGACGAASQPCCSGQMCAAGNLCSGSTCVACGGASEPCCSGSSCNLGELCSNSMCSPCGELNEQCCTTGAACDSNLTCVSQTCSCGGVGQACCSGTTCTAPATCGGGGMAGICGCNTDSDPLNCGSCGHACPGPRFGSGSAICTSGTCGLSCATGTVPCNGACVTTSTDPQNCGGCGADLSQGQTANTHNCAAGRTCSSSTCQSVCEPQTTNCTFVGCVNEQTDGNHCGGCNGCGFGGYCEQGSCSFGCAAGETQCTNTRSCTNVQIDPVNCGSCGNNCGSSALCVAGTCKGFIYAAAQAECPASEPTFCSNAHTGNKGVCVASNSCP